MVHRGQTKLGAILVGALTAIGVVVACAVPAGAQPAPSPSPASGKALLPQTDLKDFPKLPVAAGPAPTISADSTESVVAVVVAGATTTTTIYDPSAGVSVQQLYKTLNAQGVKGLVDPSTAPTTAVPQSASAISCSYGTARSWSCPVVGWTNGGFAHPRIYFDDQTSARWPVSSTTSQWNVAANVDSYYAYKSCGGGAHCVPVVDAYYGNIGWAGQTVVVSGGGKITGASIKLNDTGTYNSYGLLQDVCHEQGHALGLNHNTSTNSCLYASILNSSPAATPNGDDYAELNNIYSITR